MNTTKTMAQYTEKGSKRMLQLLLTYHKEILSERLKEKNIESLYPFPDVNGVFHEHQLNNKEIMDKLDLNPNDWKCFWPSRQPQWDAILVNKNGNDDFDTVYLIEAKSHKGEIGGRYLPQNPSDQQIKNREKIFKSIQTVAKDYGVQIAEEDEFWLKKYYQIANRLAFHHKLKELLHDKTVKLIFLNFINDLTWGKQAVKTEKDWNNKYKKIFTEMGLDIEDTKRQGVFFIQGVIFINDIDVSSYNDGHEK